MVVGQYWGYPTMIYIVTQCCLLNVCTPCDRPQCNEASQLYIIIRLNMHKNSGVSVAFSFVPDEDLRGKNVVLIAVYCVTTLTFEAIAMSLYHIKFWDVVSSIHRAKSVITPV